MRIDGQEEIRQDIRVTWIGLLVNLLLIGVKAAGGVLGRSQALIADAVHSLSDLLTDAVVLAGLKVSRKSPDPEHPFGHRRLETLASALVGLLLLAAALEIAVSAGWNIYRHCIGAPNWLAVVAALISIGAKEGLYRYTVRVGNRRNSPSLKANAWHHRSDALSSVAVLIGAGAAIINPAWRILDAYAALLVSLLIFKVGLDVLWQAIKEFIDMAPDEEVVGGIAQCARGVDGVMNVHDLKVRTMAGRYQAELHVVVDAHLTVKEGHRIAKEVEKCLHRDIDLVERIIVHIDPHDEEPPRE